MRQARPFYLAVALAAAAAATVLGPAAARADDVKAEAAQKGEPTDFEGADGWRIRGTLYKNPAEEKAPVVILAPMLNHDRSSFDPVVKPLLDAGWHVVAIDLRGHGESLKLGGKERRWKEFKAEDWDGIARDLAKVAEQVRALFGVDEIAVIGASIGANAAVLYGAEDPKVKALVLLSPGLDFKGLRPLPSVRGYILRGGKLLAVASRAAEKSHEAVNEIVKAATEGEGMEGKETQTTRIIYDGAGHGTDMFAREAKLIPEIVDFLKGAFSP